MLKGNLVIDTSILGLVPHISEIVKAAESVGSQVRLQLHTRCALSGKNGTMLLYIQERHTLSLFILGYYFSPPPLPPSLF